MELRTLEDERLHWHQAYREHGPSILVFLTSRVGRREVAEEFLQETFVRAMRSGAAGASGPGLRSYLFTTAHHLVVSERRRRRIRLFSELSEAERAAVADPPAAPAEPAESALDLGKIRERLDGALRMLGSAHRLAFQAAVLDQRPYAEIALEQGWTVEQVKVNVHRARKKVIALLSPLVRPEKERSS